jgi:hypothetical protein
VKRKLCSLAADDDMATAIAGASPWMGPTPAGDGAADGAAGQGVTSQTGTFICLTAMEPAVDGREHPTGTETSRHLWAGYSFKAVDCNGLQDQTITLAATMATRESQRAISSAPGPCCNLRSQPRPVDSGSRVVSVVPCDLVPPALPTIRRAASASAPMACCGCRADRHSRLAWPECGAIPSGHSQSRQMIGIEILSET